MMRVSDGRQEEPGSSRMQVASWSGERYKAQHGCQSYQAELHISDQENQELVSARAERVA